MASQVLTISSSHDVSLRMTVQSHGWVALEPWKWDEEAGELSRTDLLGGPTTITVAQSGPRTIEVRAEGTGGTDNSAVEATARRWLSLDWDPAEAIEAASAVDSDVADVIRQGGGTVPARLELLRGLSEDGVHGADQLGGDEADGRSACAGDWGGFVPTPVQVLDAGEAALRERASLGFRAKGIMVSTEGFSEMDWWMRAAWGRKDC